MAQELGKDACIFQIEVSLTHAEQDRYLDTLADLANAIGAPSPRVVPVVTNLQYKLGIGELDGAARNFRDMITRSSYSRVSELVHDGAKAYEERLGILEKSGMELVGVNKPSQLRVSDVILTVTTFRGFIDFFHSLDTAGIDRRFDHMRGDQSWMIYMVDCGVGIKRTKKGALKLVDTWIENVSGSIVNTTLDEVDPVKSDLPMFSSVEKLKEMLVIQGLLEPTILGPNVKTTPVVENIVDPSEIKSIATSLETILSEEDADFHMSSNVPEMVPVVTFDEAPVVQPFTPSRRGYTNEELMDILRDRSPIPKFNILSWIAEEGSAQSHRKDVLNQFANLLFRARDASDAELRNRLFDAQTFLVDALKQGLITEYMGRVCANYIHSDVGHEIVVDLKPEPKPMTNMYIPSAKRFSYTQVEIYDILTDSGRPFKAETHVPTLWDMPRWIYHVRKADARASSNEKRYEFLFHCSNELRRASDAATVPEQLKIVYDLQRRLVSELEKGLPEDLVREIVKFTCTYVNRSVAAEFNISPEIPMTTTTTTPTTTTTTTPTTPSGSFFGDSLSL